MSNTSPLFGFLTEVLEWKRVDFSKGKFLNEQAELALVTDWVGKKQKCSGEINIGKPLTDYFWECTAHMVDCIYAQKLLGSFCFATVNTIFKEFINLSDVTLFFYSIIS